MSRIVSREPRSTLAHVEALRHCLQITAYVAQHHSKTWFEMDCRCLTGDFCGSSVDARLVTEHQTGRKCPWPGCIQSAPRRWRGQCLHRARLRGLRSLSPPTTARLSSLTVPSNTRPTEKTPSPFSTSVSLR